MKTDISEECLLRSFRANINNPRLEIAAKYWNKSKA